MCQTIGDYITLKNFSKDRDNCIERTDRYYRNKKWLMISYQYKSGNNQAFNFIIYTL